MKKRQEKATYSLRAIAEELVRVNKNTRNETERRQRKRLPTNECGTIYNKRAVWFFVEGIQSVLNSVNIVFIRCCQTN